MAEEQNKKSNSATNKAAGITGSQAGKIAAQSVVKAAGITSGVATGGLTLVSQEIGSRFATFVNKYKGKIAAGASGAVAAPFAIVSAFVLAVGGGLVALGTAIAVAVIGIPLAIAFILLITTNSAYIVPPSSSGGNIFGGEIPDGCPAPIWPVSVGQGQAYRMSQGPGGSGSHDAAGGIYSFDVEAVDIAKYPQGGDGSNHLVIATHPGTVTVAGVDNFGGLYVVIKSDCSPEVVTNYVHMWNLNVQTGQRIQTGDILGVMGCTGYCGGIHVHYEFLTSNARSKNRELHPPPYMTTPYIPETPPFGCVGYSECQIEIR